MVNGLRLVLFLGLCLSSTIGERSPGNPFRFYQTSPKQTDCGYASCPVTKPGHVNVHIVPHSHDDVGWLKTLDEYFYGDKNEIQRAGIQYIFESVVKELALDSSKRFIQVETAFFWQWYKSLSDSMKSLVFDLVSEGRLEFIGGGWSMNDEAAAHYYGIVDNMAVGFMELKEHFGHCGVPKVAWQIDPFGHSREQASLFAQMGFDGLFFARMDFRDKAQRKEEKNLLTLWEGTSHMGESSHIFTGALPEHYSAPRGFCFDLKCTDDPINDDIRLKNYNLDEMLANFEQEIEKTAAYYEDPSHIMFTFGDDFHFMAANQNYLNIDKLIYHMNQRTNETNYHVFYSTPSCYLKALNDLGNVWSVKEDDFFPYASDDHAYWTGYYTSRPAFKQHERQSSALLAAQRQLEAFTVEDPDQNNDPAFVMARALGASQHHDAITGTAKQPVDRDYQRMLSDGHFRLQSEMSSHLFSGLSSPSVDLSKLHTCPALNTSSCSWTTDVLSPDNRLVMAVYNPASWKRNVTVRLPLNDADGIEVHDPSGDLVNVEYLNIIDRIINLPGRESDATKEAIFRAADVPPLGYALYYIERIDATLVNLRSPEKSNDFRSLRQGALNFQMGYYLSAQDLTRNSGAYIFRPKSSDVESLDMADVDQVSTDHFSEYRFTLNEDWASYTLRQYDDEDFIEVDWIVGPIPVGDDQGKEVIMRYHSEEIVNNGIYYTDANGRQMIQRIRDQRASYNFTQEDVDKEPVSSNYYPITAAGYIVDETTGDYITVMTDRAEGGGSITDGNFEVMLHRRCLRDDGFGVGEALNETAFEDDEGLVVRGTHKIFFGQSSDAEYLNRQALTETFLQPILFFTEQTLSYSDWESSFQGVRSFTGLDEAVLPEGVHVMTLMHSDGDILLRLEHLYGPGESTTLSVPLDVDLENLFKPGGLTVLAWVELALGGNMALDSVERLHWDTGSNSQAQNQKKNDRDNGMIVTLDPAEIRTFLVNAERN